MTTTTAAMPKTREPLTREPLTETQKGALIQLLRQVFTGLDYEEDGSHIVVKEPHSVSGVETKKRLQRMLYDTEQLVEEYREAGRPRVRVRYEESDEQWPRLLRLHVEGTLKRPAYRIAEQMSTLEVSRGPAHGTRLFCQWESTAKAFQKAVAALQVYADEIPTLRELKEEHEAEEARRQRVLGGEEAVTFRRGPHRVQITPVDVDGRTSWRVEGQSDAIDYTHETKHWSPREALHQASVMLEEMEMRSE